jgi:gluconolactonase
LKVIRNLNKANRLPQILVGLFVIAVCAGMIQPGPSVIGRIERLDPELNKVIMPGAKAEIIATGMEWSEGPLWVEEYKMLLWSDVPRDTIWKWTEKNGKEVYLSPSGYTGSTPRKGEKGSNGLILDPKGNLVLCMCGDRRMARMEAPLNAPKSKFVTLAGSYGGRKFDSPNDGVYSATGELYFTDPPYGLERQQNDPLKEMKVQGVYKVKRSGEVVLLVDSLHRPNGIAFFPGGQQLLIANSQGHNPGWYIYDVTKEGLANGRLFYSSKGHGAGLKGVPDGIKINKKGYVFTGAPGGLWIFNKSGKLIGKLSGLPAPASNCSFSADEKTLYITNDMNILRIKLRN